MNLMPGMFVSLPSGNTVSLIGLEAGEWLCMYSDDSEHSGMVYFRADFLQAYGKEVLHGQAQNSPKGSHRPPDRRVAPSRSSPRSRRG